MRATSARLALAAAVATLVVSLVSGTWVAGGSDSYCYVEQAERWASGAMLAPQALDFTPPWADRWLPLAPTGFVPSPTVAGALAPICPSGLALTMAPPSGRRRARSCSFRSCSR